MIRSRHKVTASRVGLAPVLKLPPELALPATQTLAKVRDPDERRHRLSRLRHNIPARTLLNAYVLPSLNELNLYSGSLRDGEVTRYGRAVAEMAEHDAEKAAELLGRQLLAIDGERVGFVDWFLQHAVGTTSDARRDVYVAFYRGLGTDEGQVEAAKLDRLGKWVGYLVYFHVLRGDTSPGANSSLAVDARHIKALCEIDAVRPSQLEIRRAFLESYAQASRKVGSRLYIPVGLLRDELGKHLEKADVLLTDVELDAILRRAPELLPQYTVTFSPFSGPARGGLKLGNMYAGFVSVRPRSANGATA